MDFLDNVAFVQPHFKTQWGRIPVVYAFFSGLRMLFDRADSPEWFVLLSGSDYPVRAPPDILAELKAGGYDAYLHYRLIEYPYIPDTEAVQSKYGFQRADWIPLAYDRYISRTFHYPSLSRKFRPILRRAVIRSRRLLSPFDPFSDHFRCYGGDHWFTANRRAAHQLLAPSHTNRLLLAHYATRWLPGESLYQTILCNSPGLRICKDNKRYADWSGSNLHPKILGVNDLPNIINSGAHFARKFDLNSDRAVLLEIDEILGVRNP